MTRYYTAVRETGDFIDWFDTLDLAIKEIEEYERMDREDGYYIENFYEIEDEDHCQIEY